MSRLALLLILPLLAINPARAAADPAADAILNQYVDAIGGKAKLEKLRTRITKSKISVGWLSVKAESRQQWPDRVQEEASSLGMKMNSGYDGRSGWAKEPGKDVRTLQGRELQQYVLSHRLDRSANLQAVYPERRVLPDVVVEGKTLHRVGLIAPGANEEIWYIDAASSLLVAMDGQAEKDGKTTPIHISIEDYREVDGVKLPFLMKGDDGKNKSSIQVESMVHNQPVTITAPEGLTAK